MKNITKLKRTMTVFSVFLGMIFSGCNNNPETGTDTSGIKVLSEGQEITVNVGETITVKAEGKKAVEFSQEGLTISHTENGFFEITADSSMTDATVPVNFNDGSDEDEGINVTLYVYDPYFTLNITLDDNLASKAESISVYAEGKEDSESKAALYQTVDAVYKAGEKTASAKLIKEKANSYKFFNNIVVKIKDKSGTELNVETNPVYFCYTDEKFSGITVSESVSKKIFTIKFEGFKIPSGSVEGLKYSTEWANSSSEWKEESTVIPEITVSADGSFASFEVSKPDTVKNEFYIDWTLISVKDSSGKNIIISAGNTEPNKWYSYSGDVWTNTFTHVTGEYQNICTEKAWSDSSQNETVYVKVLDASDLSGLSISSLKILLTTKQSWCNISASDSWKEGTYKETAWSSEDNARKVVITEETFITAAKENGLYVAAAGGDSGTITVQYISK